MQTNPSDFAGLPHEKVLDFLLNQRRQGVEGKARLRAMLRAIRVLTKSATLAQLGMKAI